MGSKLSKKNKKNSLLQKRNDIMDNTNNNNIRDNLINNKDKNNELKFSKWVNTVFKSDIKNFQFLRNLAINSDSFGVENTMTAFKSIDDIFYFIYSSKKNYDIISYNIIDNKIINTIKNAHNSTISNLKYYLDKNNTQDLILSTSLNYNLKLWKIKDWVCLLNIDEIYKIGRLLSACFLLLENQIFFVVSNNSYYDTSQPIKIFDLKGIKIKEINNSLGNVKYIETYYESSNIYILTGCKGFLKSYDYIDNSIYHIYNDNINVNDNEYAHYSLRILNDNKLIKLIESSEDGNIRIWNFHTGKLLHKILISENSLFGICLWSNDYLMIGCADDSIKVLDLKKLKIAYSIIGHNSSVLVLAKINIPNYGECLLSQDNGEITKLWKVKL